MKAKETDLLKTKTMSYKQIQTYDEMNSTIKDLLERQDDNVSLYALKRIEELEQGVTEGLICPFCNDTGFDKPGLKYHLVNYCKEYEQAKFI